MRLEWTSEFDTFLTHLEEEDGERIELLGAMLKRLVDLPITPIEETEMLKQVKRAKRHDVWRLSHPHRSDMAIRALVWFTPQGTAVVAVVGFDKHPLGDIWYDSAARRAEAVIDQLLRQGDHAP